MRAADAELTLASRVATRSQSVIKPVITEDPVCKKTSVWNGRRLGGMSFSAGSAASRMPMAASCILDAVTAARWSACRMRRSPWISSNTPTSCCWLGPRRPRRGLADERDGCVASPSG